MADYHVIKLVPHDRERLLDLFKSETGGPTSQEYLEFLITVPGGGIYAAKDKQGNILGFCGWVQYGDDMGFIHSYLVKTEYRKQGIGRAVFDKCIESCSPGCNIGLSAIDEYLKNIYSVSGFVHIGFGAMKLHGKVKTIMSETFETEVNSVVSTMKCIDFDSVLKFDDGIHPFKRHKFLTKFLNRQNMVTFVAKQHDDIIGYGCVWEWDVGKYYRIMPVYAYTSDAARSLFLDLIKYVPQGAVIICSVPSDHQYALKMVSEILQLVEEPIEIIRAYTENDVLVDTKFIYSSTNGLGPC